MKNLIRVFVLVMIFCMVNNGVYAQNFKVDKNEFDEEWLKTYNELLETDPAAAEQFYLETIASFERGESRYAGDKVISSVQDTVPAARVLQIDPLNPIATYTKWYNEVKALDESIGASFELVGFLMLPPEEQQRLFEAGQVPVPTNDNWNFLPDYHGLSDLQSQPAGKRQFEGTSTTGGSIQAGESVIGSAGKTDLQPAGGFTLPGGKLDYTEPQGGVIFSPQPGGRGGLVIATPLKPVYIPPQYVEKDTQGNVVIITSGGKIEVPPELIAGFGPEAGDVARKREELIPQLTPEEREELMGNLLDAGWIVNESGWLTIPEGWMMGNDGITLVEDPYFEGTRAPLSLPQKEEDQIGLVIGDGIVYDVEVPPEPAEPEDGPGLIGGGIFGEVLPEEEPIVPPYPEVETGSTLSTGWDFLPPYQPPEGLVSPPAQPQAEAQDMVTTDVFEPPAGFEPPEPPEIETHDVERTVDETTGTSTSTSTGTGEPAVPETPAGGGGGCPCGVPGCPGC